METKKSMKADLEHRKPLFLKLGLVLALSSALFAFEWKQTEAEKHLVISDPWIGTIELGTIAPTKPEPLAKPEKITPSTLLNLVENNVIVDDTPEFGVDDPTPGDIAPIADKFEDDKKDITDEVKVFVDSEAEFPGGESELNKFIASKIIYPEDERTIGLEGTLFVSFVVEKNGLVSNVKIERSLNVNFDQEAIRVISQLPKWKPASDHGKLARQKFTIPIQFKLK